MTAPKIPFEKCIAAGGFHLLLAILAVSLTLLPRLPKALPVAQAVFLSLLAGYLNLMTSEPQLPALLLFAAAAFASYSRPRSALLWLLLLPIPVPAGECIRALYNPFAINLTAVVCSFTSILPTGVGVVAGLAAAHAGSSKSIPSGTTSEMHQSKSS